MLFAVLSDVTCFALLSRDYLAFYCVYRDYVLFCICFLLFERRNAFALLSRYYLGILVCLS